MGVLKAKVAGTWVPVQYGVAYATDAETIAGTLTDKAVTPAGLDAARPLVYIDVRAHGAVGDGVADDTAAITAAITAWLADTTAALLFSPGNYKVTSQIDVAMPNRVIGSVIEGYGAQITSTVDYPLRFTTAASTSGSHFSINGLRLDGGGLKFETTSASGFLYGLMLRDLIIRNFAGHGIHLLGVFETDIQNPRISAPGTNITGDCIRMDPSNGLYPSSINVYGGAMRGGYRGLWADSADVEVFGGTYLQHQREGIRLANDAHGSIISGVHVENTWVSAASQATAGAGIYADGAVVIIGCYGTQSGVGKQRWVAHTFASSLSPAVIIGGRHNNMEKFCRVDGSSTSTTVLVGVQDFYDTGYLGILRHENTNQFVERADPAAPSANRAVLYAKDNGSGKTQLAARFNTGSVVPLATEGISSTAYFDVRSYGAVGDGVADDTAAITAALAAAATVKGTVIVPTGTFVHTGVTVPDLVTLQGVGHQGSILRYNGTGTAVTLGNQVTLRSLRIERTGTVGTSKGMAFGAAGGRSVIDRCLVTGFDIAIEIVDQWIVTLHECLLDANVTSGIRFSGQVNNVQVRGGEIKGSVNGVLVAGGSNIVLDGVAIESCGTYGIRVTSDTPVAHSLVVHGCYFEVNGTYDISVDAGGRAFNIVGSHFLATPTSVRINQATGARVEGNFFNPGGGTPKALTIGSFSTNTYVGPNAYITGAFNPAVDDLGVDTRMVGRSVRSIPFYNAANYTNSIATHVYTATQTTKILGAQILHGSTFAVDAANYWKMTLQKYNSAGVFQGAVGALGSDTTAFTANVPVAVTPLDATHSKLVAGDTLKLRWDKTGAPTALNYPSLTLTIQETQTP